VVALLALTAACATSAPPRLPRSDTVSIHVGVDPAGIAVGAGFAWVANAGEGTVSKIDLATNRQVARVPVGDPRSLSGCAASTTPQVAAGDFGVRDCDLPRAVAVSTGAVWAGKGDTRSLVRIDPDTDRVVATIPIGVDPWFIAASDVAVWVSDWRAGTVVRVDPATNQVVAAIPGLPAGPFSIALVPGGAWVASSRAGVLSRIDTSTNQPAATVPAGSTPLPLLYAYGSLWVRNEGSETVQRIDPDAGVAIVNVPVLAHAGRDGLDSLADFGGGVWAAGADLEEIDPASNRVTRRLRHPATAAWAGGGSLWTIDSEHEVSRITPDTGASGS
jgi:virginiamycin B lyase